MLHYYFFQNLLMIIQILIQTIKVNINTLNLFLKVNLLKKIILMNEMLNLDNFHVFNQYFFQSQQILQFIH